MEFYINLEETKQEKDHKGRITTFYRCGCKCCEKCWFIPKTGHCLYGGPFAGYEEEKTDGGNAKT